VLCSSASAIGWEAGPGRPPTIFCYAAFLYAATRPIDLRRYAAIDLPNQKKAKAKSKEGRGQIKRNSMSYTGKIQMRRVLYRLKREYGTKVYLYKVTSVSNDVKTGEVVKSYEVIPVKRAILLPKRLTRKFSYDLTFLAANKNFQYGAYYDLGVRDFIIELRDVPKDKTIDLGWSVVYEHRRFEMKEINFYDHRLAVYFTANETENALPFEWHNKTMNAQITFFEGAQS